MTPYDTAHRAVGRSLSTREALDALKGRCAAAGCPAPVAQVERRVLTTGVVHTFPLCARHLAQYGSEARASRCR